MLVVLCLMSVAFAAMRIGGVTHVAFQAAAHLFIGGLIGGWVIKGDELRRKWCASLVCVLSAVEIVCFVMSPTAAKLFAQNITIHPGTTIPQSRPTWGAPVRGLTPGNSQPGGSVGQTYYGPSMVDPEYKPWPSSRVVNPQTAEDRAWNNYLRTGMYTDPNAK